ncbi:MAG: amino acid permease [Proteobacteria bacterium]|nr:amino acid permease [Pseudomonadota bacterium]
MIAGEFSGWNRGLIDGGFGGLLVATTIVTVMYVCLAVSLAEMAAAIPFAGASYAYARAAMGPWCGFLAGLAQIIEYTMSVALTVVPVAAVLRAAAFHLIGWNISDPTWWVVLYALFLFLNAYDIVLFFRTAIVLSVMSLAVLVVFWAAALPNFHIDFALQISAKAYGNAWLPNGLTGVAWAIPFAVWFYLAVEQVPMASEEARDPVSGIRKGMFFGLLTIAAAAFLTLFLNSGIAPGAERIGLSDDPLLLGLRSLLGGRVDEALLTLMAIVGSVANIHSVMFASGRSIFSLARAGYLPRLLARTLPRAQTPHMALIAGAVLGLLLISFAKFGPADVPLAAILLNMSVFGALISYVFQFLSFVVLRQRHPEMARPYRSPFGATGAVTGLVIAATSFVLLFSDPNYRLGLFGCVVLYVLGILYFQFYARHRLTDSPEENFARGLAAAVAEGVKSEASIAIPIGPETTRS